MMKQSYSQFRTRWERVTRTLQGGLFREDEYYMTHVWNVKKDEWLQKLRGQLKARRCFAENDDTTNQVYDDGGKNIMIIAGVLLGEDVAARCKYFVNKEGTFIDDGVPRTGRPDVPWCFNDQPGVDPLLADIYKHTTLIYEYKKEADMEGRGGQANVNIGLGQITSRAGECFKGRGLTNDKVFVLAGAVTDNFMTINNLVHMSPWAEHQKVFRTPRLKLVSEPPTEDTDHMYTWDVGLEGTQDMIYMVWKASRDVVLKASAEPRNVCLRVGEHVSVVCDDGHCEQYCIVSHMSHPTTSGCVYKARPCSTDAGEQLVVLKVGPPAHLLSIADKLGLEMEMWTQVQQEAHVLSRLGPHKHPSLPSLQCYGTLHIENAVPHSSDSGSRMVEGAAVVVTLLRGHPLVQAGATQLPRLSISDVEQLLWNGFDALAYLQSKGVRVCDIHMRNIGRDPAGIYYIFDFGLATTEEDRHAGNRVPPFSLEYSPIERFLLSYPGELGDAQSLIFVASSLLGYPLPWADAASQQDLGKCYDLRLAALKDPLAHLPFLRQLSPQLQRLCVDVLTGSLGVAGQQQLSRKLAAARSNQG